MLGVIKEGEKPHFSQACAKWLDGGVLTMEMQHVVQGFMAVTRVRPRDGALHRGVAPWPKGVLKLAEYDEEPLM